SVQGLPSQRKSGTTLGLPLRGSNAQLLAEVDGSTAMAAHAHVSKARRDVAQPPRRDSELLSDQGTLRRRRGNQRQHPHADQPWARLQEHALSTLESETHGRDQHRIRRFSENQEGRVECHFLRILAQSQKNHGWCEGRLQTFLPDSIA